jgi:hypothetical protein
MYSQSRLDSTITKTLSSPSADTIIYGSVYFYENDRLKKRSNFNISNGIRKNTSYIEYDQSFKNYNQCSAQYSVEGKLSGYTCEFDTLVNNKNALCLKSYQINDQEMNLFLYSMNFKAFDNFGDLVTDSTVFINTETLQHDYTSVLCYSYDNKNNVTQLIRKRLEGSTTFYGDLTEYDITYDNLGRKEKEIIKWTYVLKLRTIDSISYSYPNDKIVAHKYFTYSASGSPVFDLEVTSSDNNGILNRKQFKTNLEGTGLYLKNNVDYYYSLKSSFEDYDNDNLQYTIYPNPSDDAINLDNDLPLKYKINSLNGSTIVTGEIQPKESIFVTNLPAGLYFIEIISNTGFSNTLRFVKN